MFKKERWAIMNNVTLPILSILFAGLAHAGERRELDVKVMPKSKRQKKHDSKTESSSYSQIAQEKRNLELTKPEPSTKRQQTGELEEENSELTLVASDGTEILIPFEHAQYSRHFTAALAHGMKEAQASIVRFENIEASDLKRIRTALDILHLHDQADHDQADADHDQADVETSRTLAVLSSLYTPLAADFLNRLYSVALFLSIDLLQQALGEAIVESVQNSTLGQNELILLLGNTELITTNLKARGLLIKKYAQSLYESGTRDAAATLDIDPEIKESLQESSHNIILSII